MSELMEKLNPAQKEAVCCLDRPLRIVAGAGSGKTSVLMARIEYLIREADVYPSRIMAITFTNKAAREMKDRLEAILPEEAGDVRISTIHSLCARILRMDAKAAGYPSNFTILDGDDQKSMVSRIRKEKGFDNKKYPAGQILSFISSCKREQVDPEKARVLADTPDGHVLTTIYAEYLREQNEMFAMDFDDLLLNTDALLTENEVVRTKWQNRLDYIHVDEFQDTDPIQYSLIRKLVRPDAQLVVVGDPDQTIYSWRGASVSIIMDFEKDFPDAKTIILDQNYRSTQVILDASNALIANNRNRVKKDLFSTRPSAQPILTFGGMEDESEASFVAMMIARLHSIGAKDLKPVPYKDIAVLYRANYISRIFEKELVKQKIPYRILGGIRFFERKEIKDILAYLFLLRKPDPDDPAFMSQDLYLERIINVPSRKIGPKFMDTLRKESQDRGLSMLDVLRDPKTVNAARARSFIDVLDRIQARYEKYGLLGLVDAVVEETGYKKSLAMDEVEERMQNIGALDSDITAAYSNDATLTLDEYLSNLAIYTGRIDEEDRNAVTLSTVHTAKGMEYPVVFVSGLYEDTFPSMRSVMESGKEGMEEERRLMYVAMTRAKDLLFLTWNTGYMYSQQGNRIPSQFIDEIPDTLTAHMRRPGPVPELSDLEQEKKDVKTLRQTGEKIAKLVENREKRMKSARTLAARAKSRPKKVTYHKGDRIFHNKFKQGTILDVSGDIIQIQFDGYDHVKKINANFITPLADVDPEDLAS